MHKPPLIVLADDDEGLVRALRVRLEYAGYAVSTAYDAAGALDLAEKLDPDLMLLDIHMPTGDGFSVQERFEQMHPSTRPPVIYITGDDDPIVNLTGDIVGAFAIVSKPLDFADLRVLIEQAISKVRQAA